MTHAIMDARVKPSHDAESVATLGNHPAARLLPRYAAFAGTARSASPASHGFHHSFRPRSRAINPALM